MDRTRKRQQSTGNGTAIRAWSDLPEEIVERIGNCLDTEIDLLRFRAVCSSWRNSPINPPFRNSPSLPFKLPFPINSEVRLRRCYAPAFFYLVETTVYLFQPPDDDAASNNSASSSYRGWLIKVAKTVDGKLRLFDPLTEVALPADRMPKVLNLLDFRVSQVCKSYHVQYFPRSRRRPGRDDDVLFVKKILLCTSNFSLMAIDISKGHQLFYLKWGDDKWTKLKDASFNIADITVYKGNFYAVNRYGKTIEFDSSFSETVVSSIVKDSGRRKRLVESCGQLFLVDIVLDFDKPSLQIKIYLLDEEQHEWIQVHTLGDRIFFAGDGCCFSVSSQDFGARCRGNCIYFANERILKDILGGEYYEDDNEDDPLRKRIHKYYSKVLLIDCENTGVYTLEDGKLGSRLSFIVFGDIPWPPPSWLNS